MITRSGCTVLHSKPTHQPRYRHTDGWTGRRTDRQVDVMHMSISAIYRRYCRYIDSTLVDHGKEEDALYY